jgi:DNA-binding transcriptional LysR family regulator
MLDLVKLQTFLLAAERLSFSEAAKYLHVTQPTISHHIKELEQSLGMELFERSGGGLKLTEAGRILLPQARRLIRQSVELQQMMDSLHDETVGHLRIACSTTAGKYILPQFAARFRSRHRGVRVSILSCAAPSVVPRLLEEEVNLGVVSYEACGDDVECQEFFHDRIILIAPADHSWASRQYIEPSELLDVPIIIREPTSGTRHVMMAALGQSDIDLDDLDVFLEVGNAEAIVKTVEGGFGVSFISRLAASWALNRRSVVEIPVAGFDLHRTVYMIRPKIREANRAVEVFWGFVHDPANADLLHMAEK